MNAAKEANRKQKLKLVSGFATSGLATKEFCKLHNLPEYIFYYWLKQVKSKKPAPVVNEISNFVPVKMKKEEPKLSTGPTVELVCPNGIILKFYSPVSFSELRSLIK